MVQKSTKSKKASSQKSAILSKGKKQPAESAAMSNACGDIEETQNNNSNLPSNTEALAGTSNSSHTGDTDIDINRSESVKLNGMNSVETELETIGITEQPVENQERTFTETAVETHITSRPVNKKGKKQKETESQMEEKSDEIQEETVPQASTSKKRKMSETSEPEETKQAKLRNEGHMDSEVKEEEPENVGDPSLQISKSPNKKKKAETIQVKSIRVKRSASSSISKIKSKMQKETQGQLEEKSDEVQEETASEPEESKQAKVIEGHTDLEIIEEEPENIREPITQTSKSPNKKKKAETIKAKSIREKRSATSSISKIKSKRQKVSLNIPSFGAKSGKVFVIGENDVGQLGFGEEVEVKKRPAMLELPHSVVDIAAGGMHSVCLTESGEVITFGCNDEGALGRVTSDEGSEFTPHKVEIRERIVQVSAGDSHSAALTESGQVYLWGNFRSGDGPMGLTPDGAKQVKPIRILNNITIVKISSGTEHIACLSNEGIVYTCGCGENGQLGRLAERACRDGGRKGRSALLEPAAVQITSRGRTVLIEDIWCGSYTTFLKAQETGSIYAFGLNNYNHLGYENERVRFTPKQISSFNNRTWLQITGGQHHTLALDSESIVYALGRKEYGRLGLGEDCDEKSIPTVIPTLENEKCSNISCGNCVSFAVTENGSVYSWGMGTNHQLGHGNDDDCHVPHRIEGNFLNSWKAYKISGGGQHTLILACPKESAKTDKK